MRKTKTIKELISHVKIKHDKYADLVWAARKPPIDKAFSVLLKKLAEQPSLIHRA